MVETWTFIEREPDMRSRYAAFLIIAVVITTTVRGSAGTAPGRRNLPVPIDTRVAALIEKTVHRDTEAQAFQDLESLGCAAVPSIIRRMDDRRKLPVHYIALKNTAAGSFEAFRQYAPELVVDALAAILNQVTAQHFGFIYNGTTDAERTKTIQGWREFLRSTPPDKLCDGTSPTS